MGFRRFAAGACLAACLVGAAGDAEAAVLIQVDKSAQEMTVTVDGKLRYTWPVSTGTARYDTPEGSFRASRMEVDHFSREWDNAPMPHSIFFTDRGHAIHGTPHARQLGMPASKGCVRLSRDHARTLFALVKDEGMSNTRVTVSGDVAMALRRGARQELSASASRSRNARAGDRRARQAQSRADKSRKAAARGRAQREAATRRANRRNAAARRRMRDEARSMREEARPSIRRQERRVYYDVAPSYPPSAYYYYYAPRRAY